MPGRKGWRLAVVAAGAFGEDEDGVAAVEGVAGVGEGAAEAAQAGKREDVEEGGQEPVGERGEGVEERVVLVAGVAEVLEHLAGHGDGDVAAELGWERVEDQRAVVGGDVVGDDQEGAVRGLGGGAGGDAGGGEEPDQRARDDFEKGDAEGLDGTGPRPAGVGWGFVGFGLGECLGWVGWAWLVGSGEWWLRRARRAPRVGTVAMTSSVSSAPRRCSRADCSCTRPRLSRCRSSERRRWLGSVVAGGCSPVISAMRWSRGSSAWGCRGGFVGGQGGAGPGGDGAAEELAGGGVGELQLGPAEDAADLLEVGEGAVGLGDGGL